MPTATQSYVKFNSLINVDVIKVDKTITATFDEAFAEKEEMRSTTVLWNSFVETIDASYFAPDSSISGANFVIYRRTPNQRYYDYICELQNGEYRFTDYNVVNNQYYHYLAAVELSTSSGIPEYAIYQNREESGELEYVKTSWGSWSICDIEESADDEDIYVKTGNTWTLMYNIAEENLTQNLSVTTWDTLGRYPKISIGQKDYDSSSFSGLLGLMKEFNEYDNFQDILDDKYQTVYQYTERENLTDPYSREMEKLLSWKAFCNNGNLKLLKDIKGDAWIVQILTSPSRNIAIQSNLQLTTITFEWQEVVNKDEVSIIRIY